MTRTEQRGREGGTAHETPIGSAQPPCPVCGGRMWDNRATKTNPRAPDFRCRTPDCTGRIWPGQGTRDERAADADDGAAAIGATADIPTDHRRRAARPGPLADAVRTVVERVTAQTKRARTRAELRACYLDVTDFVLAEVRPKYDAAGVPCAGETVAAITATLFIATCDRGAVGLIESPADALPDVEAEP